MKKIYFVDEEEKRRILSIHESETKRKFLSEAPQIDVAAYAWNKYPCVVNLAKQKGDLLKKISKEQSEFFQPNSDKKKLAELIRNSKIDLLITQLELIVKTLGIEKKPTGTSKALAKQTKIYLQTISNGVISVYE
jgi:hypothetical protein